MNPSLWATDSPWRTSTSRVIGSLIAPACRVDGHPLRRFLRVRQPVRCVHPRQTAPMAEPVIRTEALAKRFGDVVALDGLDLEVPQGQAVGFLGPNGAGKSTT